MKKPRTKVGKDFIKQLGDILRGMEVNGQLGEPTYQFIEHGGLTVTIPLHQMDSKSATERKLNELIEESRLAQN